MASVKREQLIEAALELFCQNGFHATGIDKILAKSGVSKMTLYKHFKSKDELIISALRRKDELYRQWLKDKVEELAETPADRILAVFDALDLWFNQEDFSGCMFANAAAEYGRQDNPVHIVSAEHKRLLETYLTGLIKDAGYENPDALSEQILLLLEGSVVSAHVAGEKDSAKIAKKAATTILRCSQAES